MSIDLIKENIESVQALGENIGNIMIKEEYIIPDTMPDVIDIIDVKVIPKIKSKEVMRDKVYIEGEALYEVLYKGREGETFSVYGANYKGLFKDYIGLENSEKGMNCKTGLSIEHIKWNIINERKIGIEGILNAKVIVYKENNYNILKDIKNNEDVQTLKIPFEHERKIATIEEDLVSKVHFDIPQDKSEAISILSNNLFIYDRKILVEDNKIKVSLKIRCDIVYKTKEDGKIVVVSDNMILSKDIEYRDILSDMNGTAEFSIIDFENTIKEDDLGERRGIDGEVLVKADIRITSKESIEILQDAYSKDKVLKIDKENYKINFVENKVDAEVIIKSTIDFDDREIKPSEIIYSRGELSEIQTKVLEDKVVVEGVVNAKVLYKTNNEENIIKCCNEDIPFTTTVDVKGAKIDMEGEVTPYINVLDINYENGSIKIKTAITMSISIISKMTKEFALSIEEEEGNIPTKKGSFIIYTVQKGDTLWKIAKKYYTSLEEIIKINEISDSNKIDIGQKVIIPGRAIL